MFVGYLGTYIALSGEDIIQCHLCSWSDKDRAEPLTADCLVGKGYEREEISPGRCAFHHKGKGYLSLAPDMTVGHVDGVGKTEVFQEIAPSILPAAPEKRPLADEIEKNIHQIWISQTGDNEYPSSLIENREKLRELNKDYKYYCWTEGGENDIESFILKHYNKEILGFYNSINPCYCAAKADFFRYLCIYAIGGVYLDIKSTIGYPLERIIRSSDRFLVSVWWHGARQHPEVQHMPRGEYEQYHVICASGHPVIWRLIYQIMCLIAIYNPEMQGVGAIGTFIVTGPIVYSRMIEAYGDEAPIRHIHSLSNGIEYSVIQNVADYRLDTGQTHYSNYSSPLILDLSREDDLKPEFSSRQRLWLMDGWGRIINYSDPHKDLIRERLIPSDYPDFFLISVWPVLTPCCAIVRRSFYIPRTLPPGNFLDAGECRLAIQKCDGSNGFFSVNARENAVNWMGGSIGGGESLIPLTKSMMDAFSIFLDKRFADVSINGSTVEEGLMWADPFEDGSHYFSLAGQKIPICRNLEVLAEVGNLPLRESSVFSLKGAEDERLLVTVMRSAVPLEE